MLRKLLTDHVRYLLTHPEELNKGKYEKPQTRGKFYSDRRKDFAEIIGYLTLLAETLPEQQLRKTFTQTSLEPLIKAVLKRNKEKTRRVYDIAVMLLREAEDAAWKYIPNEYVNLLMASGVTNRTVIIKTANRLIHMEEKR